MRVGIVYSGTFPEGLGAARRIHYIARLMQRAGAHPTVLITLPGDFGRAPTAAEGVSDEEIPFQYVGGLLQRRSGMAKFIDYAQYFTAIWRKFPQLARRFDAFYIYASTPYFLEPLRRIIHRMERPFVLEKTELWRSLEPPRTTWKARVAKWLTVRYEDRLLDGARGLVVISPALDRHYQWFPGPRLLLPVLADYEWLRPIHRRSPTYRIGYVGTFSYKDGIDGILRAFLRLHHRIPHLRLSLIGYSPAIWRIQRWVKRYRLERSVDFHLSVPDHQLPALLAECDTLVINRRNVPASRYGFPTKLAEYLATANPVIAAQVGDLPHYFTHGRDIWFVPPDDEAALENAIAQRYDEYERFQRIGHAGRTRGRELFHYEHHLPKIQQVLQWLRDPLHSSVSGRP